jgi:hypothetical protein
MSDGENGRKPHEELEDEAEDTLAVKLEQVYARLGPAPKEQDEERRPRSDAKGGRHVETLFPPDVPREEVLAAELPPSYWLDVRQEWAQRVVEQREREGLETNTPNKNGDLPTAGVPGANNWVPIGPSVARKGQATGNPPISGRAGRLAIAPGGMRVYVASADGGVWRSDNGGESWRPTMDGFDLDPAGAIATSNTCGAIAIDPANPDRVYVGTGEGDVDVYFGSRLLNSLPSYRGVGPIVSNTGGASWTAEPTDSPATSLVGAAFFDMAIDPADPERVVAGTSIGLYRREPDGAGGHRWTRKRPNRHSSVVACLNGATTTFYAAEWGVGVFVSSDGDTWAPVGTGFPAGSSRISVAAQPTDETVLYALVASGSSFQGLYRLDGGAGPWRVVSGLPSLGGQAVYNIPLAVDPNNVDRVYMAGQVFGGDGSIFRCAVTSSGAGPSLTYSMTSTFIGTGVHADVHDLVHVPGDSSTLWTGCDGGVWRTTDATGAATFEHRNTGLATFCCNQFSQDPAQPAIGMVGLQDNGTARYTGEEAWLHVAGGDGGTPAIDWSNSRNIIVNINGSTYLSTNGAQSSGSFSFITGAGGPVFGSTLATTPYNPGTPADSGYVAWGAGMTNYGRELYISSTFGASWGAAVATFTQRIFALDFASSSRLYVGTTGGQVFQLDRTGTTWSTPVRIDNAAGGALPLAGLITDIEVDPFDTTESSVYVTFGGVGDARHVWHYDGTQWTDRSGSGSMRLLDSAHNAIVVDPANTSDVYVGADVGVWRSTDRGMTWSPMQNGLPDAAVFDLQLHPTARLLRAATHGRGMFEWRLDPPAQADVDLYVRDTALDVGRFPTVEGFTDPETWPAVPVLHYLSRNIKVDVPTPAGYQTPTSAIDFLQFNDVIVDGSAGVATIDPAAGTVVNRVYVEAHNRGIVPASSVQVTLLVTRPAIALAPLPTGYETNIANGTAISDANWQTVGIVTLGNLRAGFPQVAAFPLPSTMLPPPADLPAHAHHCSLAFLHSPQDPFSNTMTSPDGLTVTDRKVAQRNLNIVPFIGIPPPPGAGDTWVAVDVFGVDKKERQTDLLIDIKGFLGKFSILLPEQYLRTAEGFKEGNHKDADEWADRHFGRVREFIENRRFNEKACEQMLQDMEVALGRPLVVAEGGRERQCFVRDLRLGFGERLPLFVRIQPEYFKEGTTQDIHIVQYDAETREILGGNTWRLAATPKS